MTNDTAIVAAEATRQTNRFINQNIDARRVGWPRIGAAGHTRLRTKRRRAGPACSGLRVMIVGDFEMELPIRVDATRASVLASMQSDPHRCSLRWEMGRIRIGGFLADAVRAAHALDARISLCTTVPVPIPARFERFCERYSIDTRRVTGLPGRSPIRVVLKCQNGSIVRFRPGLSSTVEWHVQRDDGCLLDAVLVDPSALARQDRIARGLSHCLSHIGRHVVVGLRVDHRWDRADLTPAKDRRVWTFVRQNEAERLARRACAPVLGRSEEGLIRFLQDEYRIARLVLQLGSRGAMLLNDAPTPHRAETCPVQPGEQRGAGNTLMTVTALSAASGAEDGLSLRRGVAAATGLLAGLDLPVSFEELDAA